MSPRSFGFWILPMLLYSLATLGQAGSSGGHGHGGDVVFSADSKTPNPRLLDLFEHDLDDPEGKLFLRQLEAFRHPSDRLLALKKEFWPYLEPLPFSTDLKEGILYVLSRVEPSTARFLVIPFTMYEWRYSDKEHLFKDFQTKAPVKPFSKMESEKRLVDADNWKERYGIHQAARRIDDRIYLSADLFPYLNRFNQLALLFHEALYSLLQANPKLPFGQKSEDARAEVAKLFAFLLSQSSAPHVIGPKFSFTPYLKLSQVTSRKPVPGLFEIELAHGRRIEYRFVELPTQQFKTLYLQPLLKKSAPVNSDKQKAGQ